MSRHILTAKDRAKAHATLTARGTRYRFTRDDCKRGYERCMELHPALWYPLSRKRNGKKQKIWMKGQGTN